MPSRRPSSGDNVLKPDQAAILLQTWRAKQLFRRRCSADSFCELYIEQISLPCHPLRISLSADRILPSDRGQHNFFTLFSAKAFQKFESKCSSMSPRTLPCRLSARCIHSIRCPTPGDDILACVWYLCLSDQQP
jgi:hypothetical protein